MKFECNIDMDNDAFNETHFELSRVIKQISKEVDEFVCQERTKAIWDNNGNKIGTWKIIREWVMSKLIQKYLDDPTQTNLDKIKTHLKLHPFSVIMLTDNEQKFLADLL